MRALYTAATGMHAAQVQIENIANNLANASTTGFKKSRETFTDLMYQQVGGGKDPIQMGSGSRLGGLARDFRVGHPIATGSDTDMMVNGPGFFKVTTPDGSTRYTRDGHFRVNSEGQVTTQEGNLVEPEITVGPGETLRVDQFGNITRETESDDGGYESVAVGTLTLVTFANPGGLEAVGGNAYVETSASGEAQSGNPGDVGVGTILQGTLEGSNVDAAEELVAMITAQRGYELSSKVIQAADEMMQTAASLRR